MTQIIQKQNTCKKTSTLETGSTKKKKYIWIHNPVTKLFGKHQENYLLNSFVWKLATIVLMNTYIALASADKFTIYRI